MEDFINELLDTFTLPDVEAGSCENLLDCTEINQDLQFFAELALTDEIC